MKHDMSVIFRNHSKANIGHMDVAGAKRLKALKEENATLEQFLAWAMLDQLALMDLLSRRW